MSAIITVRNLKKIYRVGHEKVIALGGINLEIQQGEVCCILGTSGSGKSTLLNQLAGLEKPTTGSVTVCGKQITKMSEDQLAGFRQKNVGFIFQSYNLLGSMTAAENVAMPLLFRGVEKHIREREAKIMLGKVGLGSRAKHRPTEMSGGQQQRVGIARAFVAKPKIVFADEPTGNLDTKTTIEVMEMLLEMAHQYNITFILVTHDNELAEYADRIITIRDGYLVSDIAGKGSKKLESMKELLRSGVLDRKDTPENEEPEQPEQPEQLEESAELVESGEVLEEDLEKSESLAESNAPSPLVEQQDDLVHQEEEEAELLPSASK